MIVIAPAGKVCPMELSRDRITDGVPVEVPATSYYRQRLAEGSLVLVPAVSTVPESAPVEIITKKTSRNSERNTK